MHLRLRGRLVEVHMLQFTCTYFPLPLQVRPFLTSVGHTVESSVYPLNYVASSQNSD